MPVGRQWRRLADAVDGFLGGAEGECACGSESWVVKRSYMGTAEVSFSTLPSHTSTIRPTKPPTPLLTPAALHCTVFFCVFTRVPGIDPTGQVCLPP